MQSVCKDFREGFMVLILASGDVSTSFIGAFPMTIWIAIKELK